MARYVIGDIHGCSKALRTLTQTIDPKPTDELIFLGDYVDRGPDSRDVINQLIALQQRCKLIALRGNHEIMLLGVALGGCDPAAWLRGGGAATVASYGGAISKIPSRHLDFFRGLLPHHETEKEIFVHAMYDSQRAMHEQTDEVKYWTHLPSETPPPHVSGKRMYVGHTPQPSGDVLQHAHLVCLDTYCFGGGYLSALELERETIVQVDRHGHIRTIPIARLVHACSTAIKFVRERFHRRP